MKFNYGIHWFRRDLRIIGNPALNWSLAKNDGKVLGFFCFDPNFLARSDFSHHRFAFFLDTLRALQNELRKAGGDLLVLEGGPDITFPHLIQTLRDNHCALPSTCSFNRDYEPFARARDQRITTILNKKLGISVHTERDHLLIEPEELATSTGGFYQRYTPFARRWFEKLHSAEIQQRIRVQGAIPKHTPEFHLKWETIFSKSLLPDQLERFIDLNQAKVTIPIPSAGSKVALQRLEEFKEHLEHYAIRRDLPAEPGTSRLSLFLKNGSLTLAQIINALNLGKCRFESSSSETKFLKELVWREFYYSILYHCPRVEHEAFITKYINIRWENREDFFAAWKAGSTGYPIVDAAMRELKNTGWMHNRARMIVASFLTKDLHIDWRWGERYFMQELLDGDLAPNNGGWQWAASTGTDPQPYFRIFNPELQSRKFDPEGKYIRRFLPELATLSDKQIHNPSTDERVKLGYPLPIVVHSARKTGALRLYGAHSGN